MLLASLTSDGSFAAYIKFKSVVLYFHLNCKNQTFRIGNGSDSCLQPATSPWQQLVCCAKITD